MGQFTAAYKDTRPVLLLGILYAVASIVTARIYGMQWTEIRRIPYMFGGVLTVGIFILGMAFVYLSAKEIISGFIRRDGENWRAIFKNAMDRHDVRFRAYFEGPVFPYACFFMINSMLMSFFLVAKSIVPVIFNYRFDAPLAAIDKFVHFGHYPHEFIIPLFDALHLGRVADFIYSCWSLVFFAFTTAAYFFDANIFRRMRVLITLSATSILVGSVLAILLSSGGPMFFHELHPTLVDPYIALEAHFHAFVDDGRFFLSGIIYNLLLGWTRNGTFVDANAISSMPSMHVALAYIMLLYTRSVNRKLFAAALVYFLMIFLCSVYLGFHYAIDGYVSVAVVSLVWWSAGKWLDRRYTRLHPADPAYTRPVIKR